MLSEHLHDQAAAPPCIIMLAKAGLVPTGHGASDLDLAGKERIQ